MSSVSKIVLLFISWENGLKFSILIVDFSFVSLFELAREYNVIITEGNIERRITRTDDV